MQGLGLWSLENLVITEACLLRIERRAESHVSSSSGSDDEVDLCNIRADDAWSLLNTTILVDLI